MQVLTRVHLDKFEEFGGKMAAFDPITNLRVGAMVLQECIRRAAGSVEGGLSYYVGAVTVDGSFYVKKVLRVYERMHKVLAPFDLPSYKRSLTLSSDKPALPAVSSPSAPVKPFSRPQTPTQSPSESTAGTQLKPNMEPPVHSQQTSSTLLAQQLPPVQ